MAVNLTVASVVHSFQHSISEEDYPPCWNLLELDKLPERSIICCNDSMTLTLDCCMSISTAYLVVPSSKEKTRPIMEGLTTSGPG